MSRTVNHRYSADQMTLFREQVGENGKPINEAIGYLSTWNPDYPVVDLSIQGRPGEMEFLAVFRKEEGSAPGYVIGAVWHDDHFGFHS